VGERVFIGVRAFVVVVLAIVVTLLALPAPMRSSAWTPPRAPNLEGAFAKNEALTKADKLAPGELIGPESVALDDKARIYAGTTDGKIVRIEPGQPIKVFTETGGRPLGLAFSKNGDLLVADAQKGLLRVDREGHIEIIAHDVEGTPLVYLNNVAVSSDARTVYATDSSSKWGYGDQIDDILEQIPGGRFIRFDLQTREATVLVHGLSFADGIALAPDESYALVAETGRYKITRVWLSGEKRNLTDTLVDNLPGFPAGISLSPRGTYWVALYSIRKPLLDALHPFPFLKDCVAGFPDALRPEPTPYGLVFEMDATGHPLRSFHDPSGAHVRDITSAVESSGVLYLGTLTGTSIGRFRL
jgi:sugar lactone lactonase YvrE